MREALDRAESGAYGEALEALARLLALDIDGQLTRDQLYSLDYQRVQGGWQVTVVLASGQSIAGRVRMGSSTALDLAMEEARAYLTEAPLRMIREVKHLMEALCSSQETYVHVTYDDEFPSSRVRALTYIFCCSPPFAGTGKDAALRCQHSA